MARAYWCCYYSYLDYMQRLDDAERGQLFTALNIYARDGEIIDMTDKVGIAFDGIKSQIDRDSFSYEEKCKRLAINGSVGGKQKVANAIKCKQMVANGCKEKEKEKEKEIVYIGAKAPDTPKSKYFLPPTIDEVQSYCSERGNKVDAERFVNFYTAKAWMVGKNRMKDWKAAVRTWEQSDKPVEKYAGFEQRTAKGTNFDDINLDLD